MPRDTGGSEGNSGRSGAGAVFLCADAGMLLVDAFFIGICLIADEFPDHVRIE